MAATAQALIQKIELLPPERMAEVVDFVEFLQMKEQTQAFTRQAAQASAPAFAAVWDNAEDEAYDAL
jgi:Protein of unknown function (DUF2281)